MPSNPWLKYIIITFPELNVLHVLSSQKECVTPQKETDEEKSTKPKKKRKVSVVVTPAAAKRYNSHWASSLNVTLHNYVVFSRRRRRSQMSCPLRSPNRAVRQTCRTWWRSTSQTSAPWSSRRSSSCWVSQGASLLNQKFSHYLLIWFTSVTVFPPSPSRLLLPVQ